MPWRSATACRRQSTRAGGIRKTSSAIRAGHGSTRNCPSSQVRTTCPRPCSTGPGCAGCSTCRRWWCWCAIPRRRCSPTTSNGMRFCRSACATTSATRPPSASNWRTAGGTSTSSIAGAGWRRARPSTCWWCATRSCRKRLSTGLNAYPTILVLASTRRRSTRRWGSRAERRFAPPSTPPMARRSCPTPANAPRSACRRWKTPCSPNSSTRICCMTSATATRARPTGPRGRAPGPKAWHGRRPRSCSPSATPPSINSADPIST